MSLCSANCPSHARVGCQRGRSALGLSRSLVRGEARGLCHTWAATGWCWWGLHGVPMRGLALLQARLSARPWSGLARPALDKGCRLGHPRPWDPRTRAARGVGAGALGSNPGPLSLHLFSPQIRPVAWFSRCPAPRVPGPRSQLVSEQRGGGDAQGTDRAGLAACGGAGGLSGAPWRPPGGLASPHPQAHHQGTGPSVWGQGATPGARPPQVRHGTPLPELLGAGSVGRQRPRAVPAGPLMPPSPGQHRCARRPRGGWEGRPSMKEAAVTVTGPARHLPASWGGQGW